MPFEFSYLTGHSYKEYVAQQYLKENMDIVVAKNVRSAVGSIDDIYKQNKDRLSAGLTDIQCGIDRTNENLEHISFGLDRTENTLDVVNSNIINAFQALFPKVDELDASLAHIGHGIDTLIEIARNPVQTWSFNQYAIARDAMRRKLFPEALEALNLAINGNDQHSGYKTEFRFHQLRGVVLLGIPGEPETLDLIDLKAAENAFLLAARYARHDHPTEAAQALVGAGKAAHADERLADAVKYFIEAVEIDQRCGEANYQLARLTVYAKRPDLLERFLCAAFDIHWSFAIRAASDAQFASLESFVEKCVRLSTVKMAEQIQRSIYKIATDVEFLNENSAAECPIDNINQYHPIIADFRASVENSKSGLLKNVFDARAQSRTIPTRITDLVRSYCSLLTAQQDDIAQRKHKVKSKEEPTLRAKIISYLVVGVLVVIFVSLADPQSLGQGLGWFLLACFVLFMPRLQLQLMLIRWLERWDKWRVDKVVNRRLTAIRQTVSDFKMKFAV